jgi:hypothetical protein
MKNYHIIIISLCLLLSSCGVSHYVPTYFGDKFPPTSTVDIYYSAHDVKQNYKVIGHISCANFGQDAVKAKLSDYAKTIGADAIIITGTENTTALINADALKYTN